MKLVKVLAISVLGIFLAACNTSKPIYNVENATVNVVNTHTASTQDVKKAILRAANQKGWQVKELAPGKLEATVHVRDHVAVVDIDYSDTHYSIRYKNSTNLDHKGDTIHRNYNKWVILLDREIQKALLNTSL